MLKHKGGSPAKDGFYWKKGDGIVTVEGENGRLPGGIECEYIKVPDVLFAPVALIAGVAFVIVWPFAGFAISMLVLR